MKKRLPFLILLGWLMSGLNAQNSLHFDGSDDYVICGTDTSLSNFNYNLTIEAWVYADQWKTNVYEGGIVVKEDNSNNYGYMLRAGNGGRLNFAIGQGSWRELTTTSAVMKTGQWYHVAATYDGYVMRLYVDGIQVDSLKETDKIGVSTSTPLTIGSHSVPTSYQRFWSGNIDEVRIWKTTRTAAEIAAYMNDEFCKGEKGLVLYYKFNEGTANASNTGINVTKDYSGKKNDGKLLNFSLIKSTSNWVDGVNLSTTSSSGATSVRKCDSYRLPASQKNVYQSGVYKETIDNYMGCDSVLTINLTIESSSFRDFNLLGCDSVKSPSSSLYYTKSGTYKEILKNYKGCDSVLNLEIVVTKPKLSIKNYVNCNEVTLEGNGKRVSESGIYSDTFKAWGGCDSIIEHRVEVLKPSRDTQTLYLCGFLICPTDKNVIFKQVGIYYDTILNVKGCDSFIVYEVLTAKTSGIIDVKACSSYRSPSKSYTWTVSGVYYDTLIGSNRFACDSFLQINLSINKPQVTQKDISSCFSYTSPKGKTISTSQKIYENVPSYLGCDSIQYIYNVTIVTIDDKINRDWNTLISASKDVSGAKFQWLDCKQNMQKIDGETSAEFAASGNGEYAVEITQGSCIDTSRCTVMTYTSKEEIGKTLVQVYPNPNDGNWQLQLAEPIHNARVAIWDASGKLIWETSYEILESKSINTPLQSGIYTVLITGDEVKYALPLMIK